jgi:hypothetical protein
VVTDRKVERHVEKLYREALAAMFQGEDYHNCKER